MANDLQAEWDAAEPISTQSPGPHPIDTTVAVQEPTSDEISAYGLGPNGYPVRARAPKDLATLRGPDASPSGGEDLAAEWESATPISSAPAAAEDGQHLPADDEAATRRLTAWRAAHAELNPEQAANILRYSAAAGVDPQVFASLGDISSLKFQVDTDQLDRALAGKPHLTQLLNDVARGPIAKHDTGPLGWLESAMDGAQWLFGLNHTESGVAQAFRAAHQEQKRVFLGFRSLLGQATPQDEQYLERVRNAPTPEDTYGAQNWFTKTLVGGAEFAPMAIVQGLTTFAGAAAGAAVGLPGGGKVGSAAFNFIESASPIYQHLLAEKKADGTPLLTQGQARAYAVLGGAAFTALVEGVTGGIGRYLLDKMPGAKAAVTKLFSSELGQLIASKLDSGIAGAVTKSLPGGEAALSAVLPETSRAVLPAADTLGQAATRLVTKAGVSAGAGALYMGHMAGLDAATQYVASKLNDPNSTADIRDVFSAWRHAAQKGFEQMLVLGAVGPGAEFLRDMGRIQRFEADARRHEVQTSATEESKFLEQTPADGEAFLQRVQGDTPQAKYISVEAADRYFSGKKIDPERAIAELTDNPTAYKEAKDTGAKIPIPAEKFFSKLKGTEHLRGLQDDVSDAADMPSTNEAVAQLDRQAKEVDESARAENDGADKVREDFKRKALAAGERPQVADGMAELAAHAFRRLGEYFGKTADWAYKAAGNFELVGALGERLPAGLKPGAIEPGVRAAMRARFLELSPEQRVETFFRDANTGLYNRRGEQHRAVDPSRPFRTRFELGGQKFLNDKHGHKVPDGAFRVMAQVLREHGIEDGAKLSDVEADTQSPERAQEIAKSMSERIGVPVRAVTREKSLTGDALKAFWKTAGEEKAAAVARGEFPDRKLAPQQFLDGAPSIDSSAMLEKGHTPAEGKVALDSPEAKTALERAKERSKPLADKLLSAPQAEPAAITPELRAAFERHIEDADPFDTIHFTKEGLLTAEGWHLAREVAPKKFVVSADLRGIREMNQAFGEKETDDILEAVSKKMAERFGSKFDLAHPHGDEFFAQADDEQLLGDFFTELEDHLRQTPVIKDLGDGTAVVLEGVALAHGLGETFEHADGPALSEAKRRQDAEGSVPVARVVSAEDADAAFRRARGASVDPVGVGGPVDVEGRGRGGQEADGSQQPEGAGAAAGGAGQGPVRLKLNKDGRGYFEFIPGDGKKTATYRIRLLPDADPSTLAHEFSHAFGRALADFAARKDAPEALKADYAALTHWMGYESPEARTTELAQRSELAKAKDRTSADEARMRAIEAKEEKLSHAFEQYLANGKPPSEVLARTFQRFRNWMLRAYKSVLGPSAQYRQDYGQQLELPENVQAIFHRWFAADAAVTQASTPGEVFQAIREKMTPEERAKDDELAQKARDTAVDQVLARVAKAQHDEVSGFIGAERAKVREEVKAKLEGQGVYAVLRYLQDGDSVATPGETPEPLKGENGAPMKLSRTALVKEYGKDFVKTLPRGIFTAKGDEAHAISADELATVFNFDSGKELVKALQEAAPRAAVIEAEVQRLMEERFGPELLADPGRLFEIASQEVHNEADLKRTAHAIESLRRQMGAKGAVLLTADRAEAIARRYVDAKTVGELTRGEQGLAGQYRRNEQLAAQRAADAFRKGNTHKAETEMTTQLLNQAMYRRAVELRTRLEKAQAKLEAGAKDSIRQQLGKADPTYLAAHDAILGAVGLRDASGSAAPRVGPLRDTSGGAAAVDAFVASAGGNAQEVGFDVDALKELLSNPKRWKDLTIAEAENVAAAAQNIRHAAREVNHVLVLDRQMSMEEFVADVARRLQGLPVEKQDPRDPAAAGLLHKVRRKAEGWDAAALKTETLIDFLTKGDESHPLHQIFVQGYLDARNQKAELGRKYLKGLMEKWEALPKEIRDRQAELVDVSKELPISPEVLLEEGPVTRSNLLMMALNTGNAGNLQRMLDGFAWSKDQLMGVLHRELTPAEWKWVQSVWDSFEDLWPRISKLEEEVTGLPPEKVQPTPITLKDGTVLKGGYFPAKYDRRTPSMVAERQADGEIAKYFEPAYKRASTNKSHTKARADSVKEVVNLNWSVVPGHVGQVLHDLSHRRWVTNAARVLENRDMQVLFQRYLGPEYAKQLSPWLKAVANSQAESIAAHLAQVNGTFAGLRGRMTMQVLGHYLPIAMGDITSIPSALVGEVKPDHLASAVLKMHPGEWGDMRKYALERSPELQQRADKIGRMLNHELSKMGAVKDTWLRKYRETAFVALEHSDKLATTPVWMGRFQQAVEQGMTEAEAARDADALVRRLFPPEHIGEMPAMLRDRQSMVAPLVMFHGYMNTMYNQVRRWGREARLDWLDADGPRQQVGAVAKLAGKTLALGFIVNGLGEFITSGGPGDDESTAHFLFRKTVTFPFYLVPFLGAAVDRFVFGGAVSQRLAPGLSIVDKVTKALTDATTRGDEKAVVGLLTAGGILLNIPVRQEIATGQYVYHAATDQPPESIKDVKGVLYGPKRQQ